MNSMNAPLWKLIWSKVPVLWYIGPWEVIKNTSEHAINLYKGRPYSYLGDCWKESSCDTSFIYKLYAKYLKIWYIWGIFLKNIGNMYSKWFPHPYHEGSYLYNIITHQKAAESMSQIDVLQCQCHFENSSERGLVQI